MCLILFIQNVYAGKKVFKKILKNARGMSGSQWYNLNIYLSICYNGIDVVFFSKIVNENE